MRNRKALVFGTLALALVVLALLVCYVNYHTSRPFVVNKRGAIVLGSDQAPIEMLLFEDFQCSHCQLFSRQILSRIQERYIDTDRVRCFLVPLPLLPGSRAVANAALTVFEDAPNRLFPFLEMCFTHFPKEKVTDQALLDVAERVGGLDLEKIEMCIQERCYYSDIDKNLKKARNLMKKNVLVPSLYINGKPVSTSSFEAISLEIEKLLP